MSDSSQAMKTLRALTGAEGQKMGGKKIKNGGDCCICRSEDSVPLNTSDPVWNRFIRVTNLSIYFYRALLAFFPLQVHSTITRSSSSWFYMSALSYVCRSQRGCRS